MICQSMMSFSCSTHLLNQCMSHYARSKSGRAQLKTKQLKGQGRHFRDTEKAQDKQTRNALETSPSRCIATHKHKLDPPRITTWFESINDSISLSRSSFRQISTALSPSHFLTSSYIRLRLTSLVLCLPATSNTCLKTPTAACPLS